MIPILQELEPASQNRKDCGSCKLNHKHSQNPLGDLEGKNVNIAWWPKSFSVEQTEAKAVTTDS